MFASDLDATSRRQLDRGQRLVQLLRQPQYSPYPVEEQIVSIWAGTKGKFDDVPVDDVLRFERDFLDYLRRESKVLDSIRESGLFDDDSAQAVTEALDAFKPTFQTSEGKLLGTEAEAEAMAEEDVEQEQIVRQKRG
jgi:F-type H+-transporting ATPase subunit alpha